MAVNCNVFETHIMLKPHPKFQNPMLKDLKVVLTFTYHYVPVRLSASAH